MPEPNPLLESLSRLVDVSGARIEGAHVVRVQSFDRASQTAEVVPQVTRGGSQLPNIPQVPVIFPGAYWDVQTGEFGVLIIGGLNWRRWWRTGEISPPEDTARNELTNGILLMGLKTQGDPRYLDADTTVLEKPSGTGEVRLGAHDAAKAAVHEDLLGDLNLFFVTLETWGTTAWASWAAAAASFTSSVKPQLDTLEAGVLSGKYESSTVKVEE